MCGIVGYTGPRQAGPILLEGLRRLEYRGYDSAGIALIDEAGDVFVEKRAGKLSNLTAALGDSTPHAGIGMAHTRWATHGRPNDLNAHPHTDCSGEITVIHNGIIENFRELRDMLAAEGHELRSETDTEAIAHLVEDAYAGDLADAVRAALSRVDGAYALVVMHRGEPDRLDRRAAERAVDRGARRRRNVHRERRRRRPRAHPPRRLPRGGRHRRRPARGRDDHRGRRPAARAGRHGDHLDARGGREGRLRPLHAQGDHGAAPGAPVGRDRPGDPRGPDPPRRAGVDRRRAPDRGPGGARCLRQHVLRGHGRRGTHPGLGRHPGPRDRRLGVPVRPATPGLPDPRDRDHAVRGNGGHDRPHATRARTRLPDRRGHEHRGLGDHPRGRRRPVPPGRAGGGGRGVEDVRDPDRGARDAGRGDRAGSRHPRPRRRAGRRQGAAPPAAGRPADARPRRRAAPISPDATSTHAGSCSSAAGSAIRQPSKVP